MRGRERHEQDKKLSLDFSYNSANRRGAKSFVIAVFGGPLVRDRAKLGV